MGKKKYAFESFAPDFVKFYESSGEQNDEGIDVKELFTEIDQSDDIYEKFQIMNINLTSFLNSNKTNLIKYLKKYYECCKEFYSYQEYESSSFNPHFNYFYTFHPAVLYLCGKYLDSINDSFKANTAYYFMMLGVVNNLDDFNPTPYIELIEDKLDTICGLLDEDFLINNPKIAYEVGIYYKKKKKYEDAFKFFEKGSTLDYSGRQSIYPFVEVSKNKYELGLLYLKGLGVEKDYSEAFDLFKGAADDIGQESIPIIGDMYYEGLGVEKDNIEAINAYASINTYNEDIHLYFKNLDESQKGRLKSLIDEKLGEYPENFDDLSFLCHIYKYRLNDFDKYNEYNKKRLEVVKNINVDDRTKDMDKLIVADYIERTSEEVIRPEKITGAIPAGLNIGDTFTFGVFESKPIEWLVININEDGSYYVVSKEILTKMNYQQSADWLNTTFLNSCFTDDEQKHIVKHNYNSYRKYSETMIYVPDCKTLMSVEGSYPKGTIKQTDTAKSLSKNDDVLCQDCEYLKNDGSKGNIYSSGRVRGIRPAMDVLVGIK